MHRFGFAIFHHLSFTFQALECSLNTDYLMIEPALRLTDWNSHWEISSPPAHTHTQTPTAQPDIISVKTCER